MEVSNSRQKSDGLKCQFYAAPGNAENSDPWLRIEIFLWKSKNFVINCFLGYYLPVSFLWLELILGHIFQEEERKKEKGSEKAKNFNFSFWVAS